MKILEEDVLHGIWMLDNQFDTADDMIAFWRLYGPWTEKYPSIERMRDWFRV